MKRPRRTQRQRWKAESRLLASNRQYRERAESEGDSGGQQKYIESSHRR